MKKQNPPEACHSEAQRGIFLIFTGRTNEKTTTNDET